MLSADTLEVPPDAKFTSELNGQQQGSFVFLDLLVQACRKSQETRASFKFIREVQVGSAGVQLAPAPGDDSDDGEKSWGVTPPVPSIQLPIGEYVRCGRSENLTFHPSAPRIAPDASTRPHNGDGQ